MINYNKYGITFTPFINKLENEYAGDIDAFEAAMEDNPYHVLIDVAGMAFRSADELIMKYRHAAADSYVRCQYAAYEALKQNEAKGNTRTTDSELAKTVYMLTPEAASNIVEFVNGDETVYYEPNTHWVSFVSTYEAEKNIADHIKRRLANPVKLDVDTEKFRHVGEFDLTDEQMTMLRLVANNSVAMLNGSAGTGKSQTLKAVLDMLDACNKTYACMAPTGIAAKVMRQYTDRPSSTIHMFLTKPWKPDYVVVDEVSMVGVKLLSRLLHAVGYKPNLILIGDKAQLASISCGSLLRDITAYGGVPHVELSKIFRYNSSGIVTIATDTRMGNTANLTKAYDDYNFVPTSDNPIAQTVSVYEDLLNAGYNMDDILVLCPFNKHIGCDEINRQVSEKYNDNVPVRANSDIKLGDKVINTKNAYGADDDDFVANGDIGWLREKKYVKRERANHFLVDFDNGEHWIKSLSNLKQAYAVSVHKSQGSSAKVVVLLIDKSHSFMLSRNLLYTAVTRAREKLVVIGDLPSMKQGFTVIEPDRRETWLYNLLKTENNA